MDVTKQFHQRLVAELQTVSPQLAAIHATRYRARYGEALSPLHCPRCGSYGVNNRSQPNTQSQSCPICNTVHTRTRQKSRKLVRSTPSTGTSQIEQERKEPSPVQAKNATPNHSTPATSSKKKGLEGMLARKRMQEKQKAKVDASKVTLADFLSGL